MIYLGLVFFLKIADVNFVVCFLVLKELTQLDYYRFHDPVTRFEHKLSGYTILDQLE